MQRLDINCVPIGYSYPDEEWRSALVVTVEHLAEIAPALSHLTVKSAPPVSVDSVLLHLVSLKRVRTVELELEHLSAATPVDGLDDLELEDIESLEELKIGLTFRSDRRPTHPLTLRNLTSLTVSDWSGVEGTYEALSLPSLRSLRIIHRTGMDPNRCRTLYQTIARLYPALSGIHLEFRPQSTLLSHRTASLVSAIEPLFALRDIRNLSVDMYGLEVVMTDEDVKTIAKSWPKLATLHLSHPWLSPEKAPTFRSLFALAHDCAHIESVFLSHLVLDATHVKRIVEELQESTFPQNTSLRVLDVELVHVEGGEARTAEVCGVLGQLFPSIDVEESDEHSRRREGSRHSDNERWKKVLDGIGAPRAT